MGKVYVRYILPLIALAISFGQFWEYIVPQSQDLLALVEIIEKIHGSPIGLIWILVILHLMIIAKTGFVIGMFTPLKGWNEDGLVKLGIYFGLFWGLFSSLVWSLLIGVFSWYPTPAFLLVFLLGLFVIYIVSIRAELT